MDYARFHDLAVNHLKQDIYRLLLPSEIPPDSPDAALEEFKAPDVDRLLEESKFVLDRKAATLLASCIKAPPALCWEHVLPDHNHLKWLKLDQPALRTDHQTDMESIRYRRPPVIEATALSFIEVEEEERDERNDNLASMVEMMDLTTNWNKDCVRERLQITPSALRALQDAINPVYTLEVHEAMIKELLSFAKVCHEISAEV